MPIRKRAMASSDVARAVLNRLHRRLYALGSAAVSHDLLVSASIVGRSYERARARRLHQLQS